MLWYRGKELIKDSADFQYKQDGNVFKLIIAEVFPDDTGVYKCIASNTAGSVTSSFYIKVEGKDQIIDTNLKFILSLCLRNI